MKTHEEMCNLFLCDWNELFFLRERIQFMGILLQKSTNFRAFSSGVFVMHSVRWRCMLGTFTRWSNMKSEAAESTTAASQHTCLLQKWTRTSITFTLSTKSSYKNSFIMIWSMKNINYVHYFSAINRINTILWFLSGK